MPKGRRGGKSEAFLLRQMGGPRPLRARVPRDEYVIGRIVELCNSQLASNALADDLSSDIIERLWKCGGLDWEMPLIIGYARAAVRGQWAKIMRAKEISFSQFGDDEGDGADFFDFLAFSGHRVAPLQEIAIEAKEALALVAALPERQRAVLMILAEGGNPLDVAEDMGMTPWEAIRAIREARANIHRVDPNNAAIWEHLAA